MLQAWYSHEPTLRRLAQALLEAGAYGFKGADAERVFAELCDISDFDLFQSCVQYGFRARARAGAGAGAGAAAAADEVAAALPEGETIATLTRSTLREQDGVVPFVAPPGLVGARLLQAAARALPAWAHESSAKMAWLKAWLPPRLAAGHRVLVFSQLMAVLSIAENCLAAWGVRYLRLDGSTPVAERQAMLDEFGRDKGIGVFLLSTKAGGLGLNLVSADTVVIHDSDWNPHADAQAVDRGCRYTHALACSHAHAHASARMRCTRTQPYRAPKRVFPNVRVAPRRRAPPRPDPRGQRLPAAHAGVAGRAHAPRRSRQARARRGAEHQGGGRAHLHRGQEQGALRGDHRQPARHRPCVEEEPLKPNSRSTERAGRTQLSRLGYFEPPHGTRRSAGETRLSKKP
jgi:hypothetical protein